MNQRIVLTNSGESGMPVDSEDEELFVWILVGWLGKMTTSLERGPGGKREDEFNTRGSHASNQALEPRVPLVCDEA